MGAAKDYDKLFDEVLFDISENVLSWRKALKGRMGSAKFSEMINSDEERQKRYARACEQRAEVLADEMDDIANAKDNDDNIKVQRDRLRIDTRKWALAKMHPKKYGDRVEHEVSGGITLHFDSDDAKA